MAEGTSSVLTVHFRWIVLLPLLLAGCAATNQVEYDLVYDAITLQPDDLEQGGIGFLTPAAATGREADKQALAQNFAITLQTLRPQVRVVALPAILSAVNAADLDQEYKNAYRDYLETGILEGSILGCVGSVGNVRYLAQLSLAGFEQQSRGRFGLLGLRLIDTKQANMRVFIQIWDSQTAAVAWEGSTDMSYSYDTGREKPVTFHDVAQLAAGQLFSKLPGAVQDDES